MTHFNNRLPRLSRRTQVATGAAVLLALGAAGGAGAVSLTRPAIEMAPTIPTAIAKLPASDGIVTIKGRVAEIYGGHIIVQDQSGRTMVDAGRDTSTRIGQPVVVQGRFDNGQLHASYLAGSDGQFRAVGPAGREPHGPRGHDGPPPPSGSPLSRDAAAPPPPGDPRATPPPGISPSGVSGSVNAQRAMPAPAAIPQP